MKEPSSKVIVLVTAAFALLWMGFIFWIETQPSLTEQLIQFADSMGIDPSMTKAMIRVVPLFLVQTIGFTAWMFAFRRSELRPIRFSLLAVFIIMGLVAAVFGIGRLPLPWPLKLGLMFTLLICAWGLATRNFNYSGKA